MVAPNCKCNVVAWQAVLRLCQGGCDHVPLVQMLRPRVKRARGLGWTSEWAMVRNGIVDYYELNMRL
jgi:hypothetical protein